MEKYYPQGLGTPNLELENKITNFLEHNCGKELFRPRLDVFKNCLEKIVPDYERFFKAIIVGGTNGKGEVSTKISHEFLKNKLSHGLLISPHILSIRERMSFDGKFVSYEELYQEIETIWGKVGNLAPSYYETMVLTFASLCRKREISKVVLEVGLGGKFDAVNLFPRLATSIVSISRDHSEILGDRLEDILKEKLGIARPLTPLVTGVRQEYLKSIMVAHAKELNYDLEMVYGSNYQEINNSIVSAICRKLDLNYFGENIQLMGRGEELRGRNGSFLIYGSHNPNGVQEVLKLLESEGKSFSNIYFSLSERPQKDLKQILKIICSYPCLYQNIIYLEDDHWKKGKIELAEFEKIKRGKVSDLNQVSGKNLIIGSYYLIPIVKAELLSGEPG